MKMMNKTTNKKIILKLAFYVLSFPILYLVFLLSDKVDFIPIFNNILLVLSILLFFAYQIFFISKFTELGINFYLKLIVTLVLIGIGFFAGYIILILSIFAIKDNVSFSYDGKSYYILNEGWIDENLVIYKKNFITMDKMNFVLSEKTFKNPEKITDKDAKAMLESYLFMEQELSSNDNKENNFEYENPKEQEILNDFSLKDVKKIPNSNFGLIEVDRAGARSRWFFVEINGGKLSFISEIPDTSPDICGEIDKEGVIFLYTKDINDNEHVYKSDDSGKTFTLAE